MGVCMICKYSEYQGEHELPGEYYSCNFDKPLGGMLGKNIRRGNSFCRNGKYEFDWQRCGEQFYAPIKNTLESSANPELTEDVLKLMSIMNYQCRLCGQAPIGRIDASDLLTDGYEESANIFNCECDKWETKIFICPHCEKIYSAENSKIKEMCIMTRKQFTVSRVSNQGAIIELGDVDSKQYTYIINHPKLQHIKEYLGSGLGVLEWSDDSNGQGIRWINAVFPLEQPYIAIDVHGKWSNGQLTPLPTDDFERVVVLDEDWFADVGAIPRIRW